MHLTSIESNDEDGDALYQDQKLIKSPSKKKHTESRPGNGTGYLLSPLFKSNMVICTPIKQKLR